ncbi:unnamed protein product, partial [Boreogadus saida]
ELRRIGSEFVKGVSEPVIKGLLDDLYHHEVFSSEEKDSVMEEQRSRADQAHCLIDMVIGKGEGASQMMIDGIKEKDQHLCSTLSSLAGVGELRRIRSEFVERVSNPVIKGLLDDLLQQKVFSTEENDSVMAERTKADQARCLIDMVMGKGERASRVMIESMQKRDEHLCSTLGLMSSPDGVGSAADVCQQKIKSLLKEKLRRVFEGIAKAGYPRPLNDIYTELFITKRGSGDVNKEHE